MTWSACENSNFFLLFPVWMFPSKYRGSTVPRSAWRETATMEPGTHDPWPKFVSHFSRFRGFFDSKGLGDLKEFQWLSPAPEGDWRMKDTDHPISHPRVHLGDRASVLIKRGCAWRDDQFGRGQNTVLGWSDPTFWRSIRPKVSSGRSSPQRESFR